MGIEDGDYVWIDADPEDRPYRGWKPDDPDYKVMRMMCRARYYTGMPKGVLRMWYNMYQASHGSVEGHETRPHGLAKNPRSNYQSMFRYGGHQSATRAWLRPTMLTDSIVRKDVFGQNIGKGFAADVYCANGAPKESFVRITKAENGGLGGQGVWRPVEKGIRPTHENDAMKQYLAGGFIEKK
jgi:nitrate reductase alpha subunit